MSDAEKSRIRAPDFARRSRDVREAPHATAKFGAAADHRSALIAINAANEIGVLVVSSGPSKLRMAVTGLS
jgi:hypothetical protein